MRSSARTLEMVNGLLAARRVRVACRGLVAVLLAVGAFPAGAWAATITVPDQVATIQAGIDSGADEVLVRPGFYPETPVIARPLILRGLLGPDSTDLPETRGLTIDNAGMQAVYSTTVADLHVAGPVRIEFHASNSMGPFGLAFEDCVVDSGIIESQLGGDQIDYSVTGCRIAGGVYLITPTQITVANNEIQGPVRLGSGNGLYVGHNTIEGPGSIGINASFKDLLATIVGNTVRGFDVGISLAGTYHGSVRDNLVENCSQVGIAVYDDPYNYHEVTGNLVRSCGAAIHLNAAEHLRLAGNVAEDCGSGIFAVMGYGEVTGNRVTRCGTGLAVEPVYFSFTADGLVSRGNVVEHCGGGLSLWSYNDCVADRDTVIASAEGILLRSENASAVLDSALVLSSRGTGITLEAYAASATRCVAGRSRLDGIRLAVSAGITLSGNTSYLNGGSGFAISDLEVASGGAAGNIGFGNLRHGISTDQLVNLQLSCNDWFGNVAGATAGLPPGATDLAVHPMFCDLSSDDVHLASGSPLASAPGCGPIGAHGIGCAGGQTTGVIEATPAISGFALARVGPVPTRGPVALEWTMPHPAAIDMTVHDVQGRAVARIAGGDWPAGRHAIEWNGHGARGRLPPGLYLIRYRHPGGETSRRIVISR